jgi:urease accessory protein
MSKRLPILAGALALLASGSAQAHHAMGGQMPATFTQGLLSGLGHPIIGVDHLLFVIGVGLIAALYRRGHLLPLAFLVASAAGAGLHLMAADLPAVELLIALSVVAVGIWAAWRVRPHAAVAAGLLGLAGLFHGYAYAESIVGAEPTPLAAYFIGFIAVQYAIALCAFAAARRLASADPAPYVTVLRVIGGAIGVAGAAFVALAA